MRRPVRHLARALTLSVAIAGALMTIPSPAQAALFTVTKTADTADSTCDADCSLREAITAANASPGADGIIVPAGTYNLAIPGTVENANAIGDLDVTEDVTIEGAGAPDTIVDAGGLDRVFDVDPGAAGITVSISDLTVQGGQTDDGERGGGVRNIGILTLSRVHVTGNGAEDDGGGINNGGSGVLTVMNGAITSNNAQGVGVFVGDGGGIFNNGNSATLSDVTVSGNVAEGNGGGIYENASTQSLLNTTVTDNTATQFDAGGVRGEFSAANSIIAGNSSGSGDDDCNETMTSQGYNIVGEDTGCTVTLTTGDQVGTAAAPIDPGLGPLNDNGGPTPTHALLETSPALDAGNPAPPSPGGPSCAPADQRGIPRPEGAACDIGAYEYIECMGVVVNRVGTDAPETIIGTSGPDGVLGFGGKDTIRTLGGKDAVCAGKGGDVVRTGPGPDKARGEEGKDRLIGGGGKDILRGNRGNDRIGGGGGNDRLIGGPGNDRLNGGPGNRDRCRQGPGTGRVVNCER